MSTDIKIEFTENTLTSFAKALVPDIREFYQSKEGQQYFEQWMKKHPEHSESEQQK